MSGTVKLGVYVVLVLGAILLGHGFFARLKQAEAASQAPAVPLTNTPPETALDRPSETTPGTRAEEESNPPERLVGHWVAYFGAWVLVLIALAALAAYDLSHYLVHRSAQFIFAEDLTSQAPEYEEAERVWADGRFLEAIGLMREYLAGRPREQYVALRIAEIYEKDLDNPLAAALEYEEVLKKKLPAERWGWAAIHLANLYSGRLKKVPEAEALLHRIIDEYPQTAAARKARERLGLPEPEPEPGPEPTTPEAAEEVASEPPPKPPGPGHNLPPGFRPK